MELCETKSVGSAQLNGSSRPLCHCLNVAEVEVREAIEVHDLQSVRSVAKVCGAGGGCTACHRHIKRLLNEHAVQHRMQSVVTAAEFANVEALGAVGS